MTDLDVLVLDFDRTLFDTDTYYAAVLDLLAANFGIDRGRVLQDFKTHQHTQDGMQHYDFFGHVVALGLDPDVVEAAVISEFAGKFVYADVPQVLQMLPDTLEAVVLTYGDPRHQHMKYRLSRLNLPLNIASGQKGPWLQNRYGDKRGLMVDDRVVADLPPKFSFVQIDRTAQNSGAPTDLNFLISNTRKY